MRFILLLLSLVLIFSGCKKYNDAGTVFTSPTASYSSQPAVAWMETVRQIVKNEGKNPPQASRLYCFAAILLYESVVDGMANYSSLSGRLNALQKMPVVNNFNEVDFPTVANEALYQGMNYMFGGLQPSSKSKLDSIYNTIKQQRSGLVSSNIINNSSLFGNSVASALIKWCDGDNYQATRAMPYTIPSGENHYWQPTDVINTNPLEPYWGKMRCFAMINSDACETPAIIPFSTTPGSAFYNQAIEVVNTVKNLTAQQKDIALWWSDDPKKTGTPSGHWVAIENQIATEKNLDLAKAAEMYVLTGIAMGDAFISCWQAKYKVNLLRPVTYIRQYMPGNNNWTALLPTPPFPEYPSGHSVASGAAASVLTKLFGNYAFTDRTNTYLGLSPRTFSSFQAAANEAAISRLYGGIHYREAIENGIVQGQEVAKAVFNKIRLQ
jgi:hypothetical protein